MWTVLGQFKSSLFILLLIAATLLLNACSSPSRLDFSPLNLPPFQLQDGELSASSALASAENFQLLATNPAMIRYFDHYVSRSIPAQQRARMIHQILRSPAFLNVEYQRSKTLTAEQVFSSATANCIGFANAYIAIARHYGLSARYQLLEKHPEWTLQGEMIAVEIHVNSTVRLNRIGALSVDIDRPGSRQAGRPIKLSDQQAKALFYNNLAIDHFSQGDLPSAYRLLVKAIQLAPKMAKLWPNLGVIYRNNQQHQAAENAYFHALQLDSNSYTAITNLAALYQHTKQPDKFASYLDKMAQLKQLNPYYHYYLALQAQRDSDYLNAIKHINRAIELKKDETDFSQLLDQLYRQSRQLASSVTIQ